MIDWKAVIDRRRLAIGHALRGLSPVLSARTGLRPAPANTRIVRQPGRTAGLLW
jgi:hypothetical protein